MTAKRLRFGGYLVAGFLICLAPAVAQSFVTCNTGAGIPPIVRATGRAELLSDFLLDCSGGTPGASISTTLTIFLNTNLTSKFESGASEALVLIDDPAPGSQIVGTNLFQAISGIGNQVVFNINFTAPGLSAHRILRITNLRANASALGVSSTLLASPILGFVSMSGGSLAINQPQQTLGYIQVGMISGVRTPTNGFSGGLSVPQCTGQNSALVDSPSASGSSVNFNVKFNEGNPPAFKKRNVSADPTTPAAQNIPGVSYATESGYFDPALSIANGLNTVGRASQGTRLMLRFDNVPAGVAMFVTTAPSPSGTSVSIGPNGARLVQTDANGAGDYNPTVSTTTASASGVQLPIAPVTLAGGSGIAVWEILNSDPANPESVSFGIVVAYKSGAAGSGTVNMTTGFAPTSSVTTNESTVVPRFAALLSLPTNDLAISPCGVPLPDLLVSSFSIPSVASAGSSLAFTSTIQNQGGGSTSSSSAAIGLYTDAALTNRISAMATCSVPPLSSSGSAPCNGSIVIPVSIAPGTYYIGAFVDDQGTVPESNETNNMYALPITILPASCSYDLSPLAVTLMASSATYPVSLTTGFGCPWIVSSDSSWLTVAGPLSGSGTANLNVAVEANSGNTRVAQLTVSGKVHKVKQAPALNSAPVLGSTLPASGGGTTQTFSFSATDANGFEDFASIQVLIGSGTSLVNACSFTYSGSSNSIFLLDTAGVTTIGEIVPGGSGSVENSQCALSAAGSSVTGAGNTLSVTVALTFKPTFAGTKTIYVSATDISNASTGLQLSGAWTVITNQPPSVVSGTPTTTSSTTQTFTFTGRDADGYADISRMYFLVNANPAVPQNTCHGFYHRPTNALYLYNDSLTGITGPLTPGTAGTLQNSRCAVYGSTSSLVSASGTDLTINLGLGLQGAYAGTNQKVYLWVKDNLNQDTGWVQTSTWNLEPVANQPPSVVTLLPDGPPLLVLRSETLRVTVRDPDGYADIYRVYFLIDSSPSIPQNSCHGFYDRSTNGLYLYNDALTAVSGPLTPGTAGTLENSQCAVNGITSSLVSAFGTDLKLNLGLILRGAYALTDHNVYMLVKDNLNHDSGWVQTDRWWPFQPINKPSVVSGTPTLTSSTPQTFTFTGRDIDAYDDIFRMYFLVNPTPSIPANSCHGFYDRASNGLYLYNDALTAVSGPLTPGTAGTLQNGQCVVYGSTSSLVSASGTDVTLNLGLGLQGVYAGTNQKVYLWVKDYLNHDTGWVQTSTWNLAAAVNQPPTAGSGMPASTTSTSQTFTFTGRDPDGFADIYRVYFLVNPTPSIPANSCHGFYDRAANGLYLYNDTLTAISGPLTPGAAGTLQNSQCVLNGSTSSLVSASGTDLTISLGLALRGAYAGTSQKVYMWVKDTQNHDTGWVQTSTWNLSVAANQPPSVVSGTPAATSSSPQTFTFTGRDPDGYADIYRIYFLVNPTSSIPANSCHGFYDRSTNGLYLYNDALTAVTGPLTPGSTGSLQNSQCVLNGSTSFLVSASGTDLTINLGLAVQGSYTGTNQKVYLWVKDFVNHDTGWVQTSTWNLGPVANQVPTVVSGTPASSTVTPQTFTFTGRDQDGYADIYRMYFLINPTPNIPANSCHGFYDRASNALYLYNDTLTAFSGPLTPGTAGTLQNSQCVLNGSTSSLVAASGTDLTINLGLSLQGAYAGTNQKVYLWVKDNQNHDTGWVQTGAWNLH
jgi:hypothetical protein